MARWSSFAPTADRRLVKGLHEGDDDAFATLYDVYAERLYDYSMALLDDPKKSADVVHDTFIDAARRAPRMRERERLRPWLYGAVRRRCLQRKRAASPSDDTPLARLDFLHREALFLAVRHDMDADDLASILGVSARRAQARLNRAERQVPDAADFLNTASAPVLPAALRHRVRHTGTDPELAGYRAEIAARGGTLTPDGMPRQPDAPSHLARRWAFASVGSLGALTAALVAIMAIGPDLPVPELHWPGERTRVPKSPSLHHDRPDRPSRDGAPGNGGTEPRPGPALIPSVPPRTSAPPRSTPPRGPGQLAVSPQSIHLRSNEKVADVLLTAKGGPVTWTAGASTGQLTLSSSSGGLPENGQATIQIVLQRGLITLPGSATITVADSIGRNTSISIAWDTSLL